MSEGRKTPPELAAVDRLLRGVRFDPRPSFGPELAGRLTRGETPRGGDSRRGRLGAILAAAALVGVAAVGWLGVARLAGTRTIDRCCFDLDGGGQQDDGALVVVGRSQRVERLRLYEDQDRSGGWTAADRIRFERGRAPILYAAPAPAPGAVATQCCLDWDGGGAPDDGLMVVRAATDRVVMAAIYETGPDRDVSRPAGWVLR